MTFRCEHPRTPENTSRSQRGCRLCYNARMARYMRDRRAGAVPRQLVDPWRERHDAP